MRCMTLAIVFSALGWIALATKITAEEAPEFNRALAESPAIDLSRSFSDRPSYVALATIQVAGEISNTLEIAPSLSEPSAPRGNSPAPVAPLDLTQSSHDLTNVHGYRHPLPFGPSGSSSILQYMACDPYSCPNIWQGHDAQRAAELAKKCSHGCGHCGGFGCGCGRTNLYSSPCMTCSSRSIKPMNRYRAAPGPAGNACGNSSCDSLSPSNDGSSTCPSCQATATKIVQPDRVSSIPSPASER